DADVDVSAVELGERGADGVEVGGLEVLHADDAKRQFIASAADGVAILRQVAAGAADEDGGHGAGLWGKSMREVYYAAPPSTLPEATRARYTGRGEIGRPGSTVGTRGGPLKEAVCVRRAMQSIQPWRQRDLRPGFVAGGSAAAVPSLEPSPKKASGAAVRG